jgi:hypothetical protein
MKTREIIKKIYKKLISKKSRMKIKKHHKSRLESASKNDSDIYYQKLIIVKNLLNQKNIILNEAFEPLHSAFKARQVRSELMSNEWWEKFVTAASTFDSEGEKIQKELVSEIENTNNNLFEHWELLHIYMLALRVGLLVVGYALRLKAREAAIAYLTQKKPLNSYKLSSALAALLETGNIEILQKTLSYLGIRFYKEKKIFTHMFNIIYKNNIQNNGEIVITPSRDDIIFGKQIKGKKIAVVGPAKTEAFDAANIDSYDLVVRCNYKEKGVGVDPEVKGLRCDLTYLNFEQARAFRLQKKVNWPDNISWVICKSKNSAKKVHEKICNSLDALNYPVSLRPQARSIENLRNALFMNTFNAFSNITMDLLRFQPDEIKIFHADMMLTVDRNDGYYPAEWGRDNKKKKVFLEFSSRSHDPVIQYWLLHTLFKTGKIKGDKRFEEVMMLGEREYMIQLQSIYGNAGRLIEI